MSGEELTLRSWLPTAIPALLAAVVLFALSLFPSLLPRPPVMQGVLSGILVAAGYGVGLGLAALWRFMELAEPRGRAMRVASLALGVAAFAFAGYALWQWTAWQNDVRALMTMPPVDTLNPLRVVLLALAVALAFLLLGRLIGAAFTLFHRGLKRLLPGRAAFVVSAALLAFVLWSVLDGVVFVRLHALADATYQQVDRFVDPSLAPPSDPLKAGSAASLIDWQELGHWGRSFIASGPSRADVAAYHGARAKEPLRVYVGLRHGADPEARAELALAELLRTDAFARAVLVVAVPVGSGWVDPFGVDTLEFLHGGDTAIVAQQYSYLTSWVSMLIEPTVSHETARALFEAVYGHWRELPVDDRPALYLHGLSLGSFGSEASVDVLELIADPVDGALWVGPTFANPIWRRVTEERRPESPVWLPRFRDGSLFRFTNQVNHLGLDGAPWGPLRVVYLQYASDPITFFRTDAWWRRPSWLEGERGFDVSPLLEWYPLVTFVQLAADMGIALSPPIGFGHDFHPHHYIDAWLAVTDPPSWTAAQTAALKERYADAEGW